jgi:hypothetical protein
MNGDFEVNQAIGCDFNLTNAAFDAEVAHATAFGTADEIDVMRSATGCGYIAPYSGITKVAIHRQSVPNGKYDAFSLDLSMPVVAGQKYHLQFFAYADTLSEPNTGAVEVGLSSSPTDFGTLVATGYPGSSYMWYQFDFDITAPITGGYLTVREGDFLAWDHIDTFSLVPICGSNAGWSNYGSGWPGTHGIPSFTSSAAPELCKLLSLNLGNSRGAGTQAALFVGLTAADIPTAEGGRLLVLPTTVILFELPAAGISLPSCVPCDGTLCGFGVYMQAWEADPGASQGVSFSKGLQLMLGS